MSACVGPRPPVSPLSSAMASSSAVTRQPAFFSCARSASKAARSSFFSAASRSSTSGAKGAPGSVAVFSTSPSSGSRISSAASMAAAIRFSASIAIVVVHCAPSSMRGARPTSMSLKSIPCGGRAMRTRRPSRFQRQAQSRAAASPGSSPSASTITSRTSSGRSRARSPEVESAAQAGWPVACMAARQVSMPSPTISTSPGSAEPHRAATAGAEHHLLRIDRRLAAAIAGEEGAVDRQRRAVHAARHQRHHRRPDAARGMLQPGMEAERRRRWKMQAARDEILLGHCAARLACLTPNAQRSWGPRPIILVRSPRCARPMTDGASIE